MKTNRNIFITNEGEPQIQSVRDFARANGGIMSRLLRSNQIAQQRGISIADAERQMLRTNDLLRKDEWKQLDAAVVPIATVRLRPLELLRQRGLVRPLDGLGVLLSQYETIGDMTAAEITMSGLSRSQEDSSTFNLNSVPVPIISKDFRINVRRLLASRRGPNGAGGGEGIDVTQVQTATRKVAEQMVSMLFTGFAGNLDGNTLKGLTNFASTNSVSATAGGWSTVANVYTDVIAMLTALNADMFFGPFGLFVANDAYLKTLTYIANVNQTALQRIQGIPNVAFVEPADQLSSGTAVMFQLTPDVIDLAIAQDIMVTEWDEQGGLTAQFKVMAAYAPRPKADANSNCGIAYISGL